MSLNFACEHYTKITYEHLTKLKFLELRGNYITIHSLLKINVMALSIRLWAALCHLTVIIWASFIFLIQRLFPSSSAACFVKPFPECVNRQFQSLLALYLWSILLWSLPFISVFTTFIIWKLKGNINLFIKKHGSEAFSFQLKSATYSSIIHLLVCMLSILFNPSVIILIILIDTFFFPVLAALQLFFAIIVALQAVRGNFIRYVEIK